MIKIATLLTLTITILNGCAVISPQIQDFNPGSSVTSIETPHTHVLSCLGEMIDAGHHSPVYINVHRMIDETIPEDFEDRGLTSGGMWLATTAITRLNSQKVVAVLAKHSNSRSYPDEITKIDLRGAFTQFDRLAVRGDLALSTEIRKWGFDLGGSENYELVTGDFTTSIDGRVLNSTAVGVIVLTSSRDGAVFYDDGDETVAIALDSDVREGRQNAQRHIIEAAVVIHVAKYFNLDYKKCIQPEDLINTQETKVIASNSDR